MYVKDGGVREVEGDKEGVTRKHEVTKVMDEGEGRRKRKD